MTSNFSFVLLGFTPQTSGFKEDIDGKAYVDFSCEGIEEFSLEEARVDEILGERAYSGGDVPETLLDEVEAATFALDNHYVKYFFLSENHAKEFVFFVKEKFPELSVHVETKTVEDWNREWKKYYTPIIISESFEVIPEWLYEQNKNPQKNQIIIYPGMGFGTGTHETTYLCLKLLEKYKKEIHGNECLDFGCGSGILGIGAMILSNMSVDFVDIDRSALENCLQNLNINFDVNLLSGSSLILRERFIPKSYDLVFANILENVLFLEHDLLEQATNVHGHLIVSGLLNHQVPNIIKKYSAFKHLETISRGDWSAIIFVKSK